MVAGWWAAGWVEVVVGFSSSVSQQLLGCWLALSFSGVINFRFELVITPR